jgi:hypothetical protein
VLVFLTRGLPDRRAKLDFPRDVIAGEVGVARTGVREIANLLPRLIFSFSFSLYLNSLARLPR